MPKHSLSVPEIYFLETQCLKQTACSPKGARSYCKVLMFSDLFCTLNQVAVKDDLLYDRCLVTVRDERE